MNRITLAVAALAAVVAGFAVPAAANAATIGPHRLARLHHCHPIKSPVRGPVAGYMIGLHSNRSAPLFYRSVDELTAGLFYGDGGDWVLREWCSR